MDDSPRGTGSDVRRDLRRNLDHFETEGLRTLTDKITENRKDK